MQRINQSIMGRAERHALDWACRHMPARVTPDMLTALGLVGAGFCFAGYWLSSVSINWLWLAIAGLVINWVGDSLDGSLARFRRVERPQYGFFLDHMTDTLAMGLVTIGIGLSPYVHLDSALAALAAYYMMTILAMATCLVTGVFRISFGGVGPTEVRLVIALCTAAVIAFPTPFFALRGMPFSIYDAIMLFVTGLLVLTGGVCAIITARSLAAQDPPTRRE
jgi:phosphatidylglycerophosphate synthase